MTSAILRQPTASVAADASRAVPSPDIAGLAQAAVEAAPSFDPAELERLGPLLGFSPKVATRYEEDTRAERIAHLRKAIFVGLVFYNTYNVTNLILMPDMALYGLLLRLLVVTPISIGIVLLSARMSAVLRETMVTAGMINAVAVPVFLFWMSSDGMAPYTAAEFPITMIFGCVMLGLRFPATLFFVAATFLMVVATIVMKVGISQVLSFAFTLQIFSACLFVIYANYKIEAGRRQAYLRTLREVLRAQQLEHDQRRLATLSNTDALTGIPNRRCLDHMLSALYETRRYQTSSITLMMIDVDYFKGFNDTYGHLEGDHCLIDIAAALEKTLRADVDFLARYGGEEFAILLRQCHEDTAAMVAERLRNAILKLAIPHEGRRDTLDIVSISIGAFVVRAGREWTIDGLMARADGALYEAKTRGRNTAVIMSDETAKPARTPADPAAPEVRKAGAGTVEA